MPDVHDLLGRYPRFHLALRRARSAAWRQRFALRYGVRRAGIDPMGLLSVPPSQIRNAGIGWWKGLGNYKKEREFGRIVGGDWDLNTMPFDQLDVFTAARARFLHRVPWEDTTYFRRVQAQYEHGLNPCGGDTFPQHLERMDRLFEEIKAHGFKTRQQIFGNDLWPQAADEVTVRIGRRGDFLFEDGGHRLAIAKLLELPWIPVLVTWRHSEWCNLRSQILECARRQDRKDDFFPINPDLGGIPGGEPDNRFDVIRKSIPFSEGSLIDLNPNFGYLCHRFENAGFDCYAVENDPERFSILNALRIAGRRRFTAVHADIFEFWEKSEFDVVLALHVLHQFLGTRRQFEQLSGFLRRLKTRVLFVEPHSPAESIEGAYRTFSPEEFVQFVASCSGLSRWWSIGQGSEGRQIYMLTPG